MIGGGLLFGSCWLLRWLRIASIQRCPSTRGALTLLSRVCVTWRRRREEAHPGTPSHQPAAEAHNNTLSCPDSRIVHMSVGRLIIAENYDRYFFFDFKIY